MSAPMAITLDEKADWMASAREAVEQLADDSRTYGSTFTADDLYRLISRPETEAQRRYWPGAVFRSAEATGLIVKAGYSNSTSRSRRGGARYEWKAGPR